MNYLPLSVPELYMAVMMGARVVVLAPTAVLLRSRFIRLMWHESTVHVVSAETARGAPDVYQFLRSPERWKALFPQDVYLARFVSWTHDQMLWGLHDA